MKMPHSTSRAPYVMGDFFSNLLDKEKELPLVKGLHGYYIIMFFVNSVFYCFVMIRID